MIRIITRQMSEEKIKLRKKLKKEQEEIKKLLLDSKDDFHKGYYYGMFIKINSFLDELDAIFSAEDF